MNNKITLAKLKAKRMAKKVKSGLSRKFDFTLSLKNKKDPQEPLLALNLKGEIPRECVAFLAIVGFVTLFCVIFKTVRKICR